MEKLMVQLDDGDYLPRKLCSIDRLGGVDDCDSCSECCETYDSDCSECPIQECFNKLAEYEKLEKLGRLKIFPCTEGDMLYIILNNYNILQRKVIKFKMIAKGWAAETSDGFYTFDQFEKTVFLSESEAEEAVKKMKEHE